MDITTFSVRPEDIAQHYALLQAQKVSSVTTVSSRTRAAAEVELPRPRKGERFIMGPLPLDWLQTASKCGGRGTEIALLLWYAAGWQKKNPVKFSLAVRKEFEIHDRTAKRVLVRMQEAGLVEVAFHRGRSPVVTLLRQTPAEDNQ